MESCCTFCKSIPKIELHAHLGGSVRNTTLLELLSTNGYDNASELAERCIIKGIDTKRSPSEQHEMFEIIGKAWKNEAATKRITKEFVQDCAEHNVVYAELRTSGSTRETVDSVLNTINECTELFPTVIVKVIVSIKREWDVDAAHRALQIAVDFKDRGVVGIDFCGNVACGSFAPFIDIFREASRKGLFITCHFAESQNETDLSDILSVNPSRLGHACYMDPTTTNEVKSRKIPIEACFASNINTMKLFSGISEHPFVEWRRNGMQFVPCTDNYGILQSSLSDHYHMMHTLNISEEELWNISEQSISCIFAEEGVKQKLYEIFNTHPKNPKRVKNVK